MNINEQVRTAELEELQEPYCGQTCEYIMGTDCGKEFYWKEGEKLKWMLTFFAGNILLYGARSTMSICVPAMSEELGWNKQVSGMALSAFFCGYVCTNMLGGHLADRIGGEIVICYAGIGWASLTALLPFIARFNFVVLSPTVAVILSRFITGLSQGVFYPSMSAVTEKRVSPSEKGFFTGFALVSGAAIGSAATGFFGSIILDHFNWAFVFILIGSLSVLWILWLRYLILSQSEYCIKIGEPTPTKEPLPWRQLISSTSFWGLFVCYVSGSYCFLNMLSWAPVYFHDTFPDSKGWLFNTIPWFVAFVVANISGYIGNILSRSLSVTAIRKLFATLQLFGYCLCSFILIYVSSFQQALFVMSMNIAANSFSSCSLTLNSQDLAPKHAGALHGFINGSGAIAGVIGVYLTGHILEVTNKWTIVFLVNSSVAFIGTLSFLIFGSGERIV